MRWLMLALALITLPSFAEVRDPHTHFFMSHLGDLKEEVVSARDAGKRGVMVMFLMEECPFCQRMKTSVLNQRAVQDYYREHFMLFSIDVTSDVPLIDLKGNETTEKAYALQHRARATPTFLFFDLEGNPLTRFTGALRTPEEFLLLGRYVVDGAYQQMPFTVFKRQDGAR